MAASRGSSGSLDGYKASRINSVSDSDKRSLRGHRRSIEWRNLRDDIVNSRRNMDVEPEDLDDSRETENVLKAKEQQPAEKKPNLTEAEKKPTNLQAKGTPTMLFTYMEPTNKIQSCMCYLVQPLLAMLQQCKWLMYVLLL